ncbi:unnamed protein product [Linum tenue]|uniref:Aminotransferase-like plant mobile domain-containing protein n=1 Tax=Linum tenue TaxID=586396 RepID=A0AAV0LG58_9ROSI|nr:unnamed protein product [Linum tenue]
MPFGEVTITLEDVATLTGLAIDGDAVIVDIPDEDWSAMCLRLLGQAPTDLGGGVTGLLGSGRLSMSYRFLHHQRRQSSLQEQDWRRAGRFAWGAAMLSYLYREMGRSALQMTASSSLGGDFGGWSALLMIWTWERFPHTSPLHAVTGAQITQDAVPRGLRWLPAHTRQHGDQFYLYKLWFDECTTFVRSGLQRYCDPVPHVSSSISADLLLIADVASSRSRARTVWDGSGPTSFSTFRG